MIILGVDPGFTISGFSLIKKSESQIILLDCGFLSLTSKQSIPKRIEQFHNFYLKKIIDNSVTHISLETPFLGKNAANFLKLGYLRGILQLLASQNNLQLLEFAPRYIKQKISGYGHANKAQVANIISNIFPKLKSQSNKLKEDTTDAIAIALCAAWKNKLQSLQK